MRRHGAAFLHRLQERGHLLEMEFNAIDVIGFGRPFDACLEQAHRIIEPLVAGTDSRPLGIRRIERKDGWPEVTDSD